MSYTDLQLIHIESLMDSVMMEHFLQLKKWGIQTKEGTEWITILMEEVGELAKGMLENMHGKKSYSAVHDEAIQVATVALKIAEFMRYNK